MNLRINQLARRRQLKHQSQYVIMHSFQRKGTQRRENQVRSEAEQIEDDELFKVLQLAKRGQICSIQPHACSLTSLQNSSCHQRSTPQQSQNVVLCDAIYIFTSLIFAINSFYDICVKCSKLAESNDLQLPNNFVEEKKKMIGKLDWFFERQKGSDIKQNTLKNQEPKFIKIS